MTNNFVAPMLPGDNRLVAIASDLAGMGWSVQPGLLPDALLSALREEIFAFDATEDFAPAGIGRDETFQLDRTVRRTRIAWLDGNTPAQASFLEWADTVRAFLNRRLLLGLFEFEACYAVYPEGGFYDRHLDSFEGARNRVLSLVVYLNDPWKAEDGGALVIWPEGASETADPAARILPVGGDVVFLLSETIPHAVEITHRKRLGMAAWWRVNQSAYDRVDPLA